MARRIDWTRDQQLIALRLYKGAEMAAARDLRTPFGRLPLTELFVP
jgi:hypothetical protein